MDSSDTVWDTVIGVGALVVGAAIGGTALSAYSKLRHQEALVDIPMLRVGDHITYRTGTYNNSSHAIIVDINDPEASVILLTAGSVKTEKIAVRRKLVTLHTYEPLVSFPKEVVAERAKSLTLEHCSNQYQRHVIRKYWRFFQDGEHFANWCHIGFRFTDIWLGRISLDYTYKLVTSIEHLREGDHIGDWEWNGVVTGVDQDLGTVDVVRIEPNTDIVTITVLPQLNPDRPIYRYDYDIAVGQDNQFARNTALSELSKLENPINFKCPRPYRNGEEFAMWCKTQVSISPKDASTLAKARINGRLWMRIESPEDVSIGDHIAYETNGGYFLYFHAIIVELQFDTNTVTCIVYPYDENEEIQEKQITSRYYSKHGQIWKYFYPVHHFANNCAKEIHQGQVVKRALSCVGKRGIELPFKDPEHFAIYCKTGSYQLHQ